MPMMFIDPETPTPVIISNVPRPILKSWKCSGFRLVELTRAYSSERMIAINRVTGSGDPMSWM